MSDRLFELPRNMPQDDWRCRECREWKPENGRVSDGVFVDGTRKYSSFCFICHNENRKATHGPQADAFRAKKMVEQKGRCAGCKRHHTEFKRGLFIDHDHATGHRRALLCNGCNLAIAFLQHNPHLLRVMAAYLRSHQDKAAA
jgi:hypothetical protein